MGICKSSFSCHKRLGSNCKRTVNFLVPADCFTIFVVFVNEVVDSRSISDVDVIFLLNIAVKVTLFMYISRKSIFILGTRSSSGKSACCFIYDTIYGLVAQKSSYANINPT